MPISDLNGTIVSLALGKFVNPNTSIDTAGVVFRIRFPSGNDLDYGINFTKMQTLVTNLGLTDPEDLRGLTVQCDINDDLEITDATPV